ncbi:hypothetical protein [Bradyrhizobium sp.]|uniref:hypothetical protein n=1 Tax=Bradyrhizobium sp. TaxID=376 RepID=UPI002D2556DB|nr:hypothetical protein [Bradyrhizobium sp.]HZR77291.1 hypothetical protein [Bradyrhizobium sp.]
MARFVLLVFMVFLTAFVGVTWATRGFPVVINSGPPVVVGPLSSRTTATFGDQSAKDYERKMWEAQHTLQSDGDAQLDAIRMEALRAANAYKLVPCGETTKPDLIAAVIAYARAWQKRMDCPRPANMLMFCSDEKVKKVAATFSTPLDIHAKEALREAFDLQGIVKADFPDDVRQDALQFTGPGLWFDESPVCLPPAQASSRRAR